MSIANHGLKNILPQNILLNLSKLSQNSKLHEANIAFSLCNFVSLSLSGSFKNSFGINKHPFPSLK